jgi:Putative Ig domain
MMRVDICGTAASLAAVIVMSASLAACGDESGSSASPAVSANTSSVIDRSGTSPTTATAAGMQIKGSPAASATVGHAYSFQPTVATAAGTTVKFSIANTPSWAKFDPASGKLTGTPSASQVGTYKNIKISVTAGTTTAALPAFSIVVADANPESNVTLSWQAPTENADGSALVDLKGYKVHYGSASKTYTNTIQVANPGLTTYVVQNLAEGKYYFAVTAYNSAGHESSLSPEVSTQVD